MLIAYSLLLGYFLHDFYMQKALVNAASRYLLFFLCVPILTVCLSSYLAACLPPLQPVFLHTYPTCLPCACLPVVLSCSLPPTSTLQPVPNYRKFPLACLAPVVLSCSLLTTSTLYSLPLTAGIFHLLALHLSACLLACHLCSLSLTA
jgi:hypothetical protein